MTLSRRPRGGAFRPRHPRAAAKQPPQPDRPRPFRVWFYPLPCGLALAGWLFLYVSAGMLFVVLGLSVLSVGLVAFLTWSYATRRWPLGDS